ncbi:malto-oligosyltrehalose synthase [Taibaiella koreensis]|uniref:malto-oligosyltrehalose synthase n=1 Tax=Taibaiella koreensis TaxID=1268548 RepID=UPI000E599A83|nr:malto-oligosyltrehalose synthase [Taibaiella koreensis]
MYLPEATYRIQFSKQFTFARLRTVIPYLHQLGISTVYASPIFAAVPGSTHGYDGIDPNAINPEIGTLAELREIASALKQRGMGWVQDFVPNHMAFSPLNPWLCDFLEKGKMSFYDHYFDKNPDEPLMAPFLGRPFPEVLDAGELEVVYEKGRLRLRYFDNCYPLNYTACYDILYHEYFDDLPFGQVRQQLDQLSEVTESEAFQDTWELLLNHLDWSLADTAVSKRFTQGLALISENKVLLQRLCEQQFYRLCYWQETDERINYRRFFTINSLIGMNMQHPDVFDHYHRLLLQLIDEEVIQGIRIDHIDGLYDPDAYLDQLRQHAGPGAYVVVEKILAAEERLPAVWPVQGTTGYDFLASVNQVLTSCAAEKTFTHLYETLAPGEGPVQQQVYRYKRKILDVHMQGELSNLLRLWVALPEMQLPAGIGEGSLKELFTVLLVCCPVYRFYPNKLPFSKTEQEQFERLLSLAGHMGSVGGEALSFFESCFMPDALSDVTYRERLLHFWRRFMQLSGPLMAKGVEDTFMYNYLRFPAHNEVGDSPESFGISVAVFHERMQRRQQETPFALNATATHDTKRGEETRARLRATSHDPEAWKNDVNRWLQGAKDSAGSLSAKDSAGSLSAKDQYMVLLAVYGSLPLEKTGEEDYAERLSEYLQKAAREAKSHSSWENPDEAYESELIRYGLVLADGTTVVGQAIRNRLKQQCDEIKRQSLSQLVLQCTCPGIPDIYQGTEYPDLSFVDPDNRRPVDYEDRWQLLRRIVENNVADLSWLKEETQAAKKLFALHRLLQLRHTWPEVFNLGLYEPLTSHGPYLSFLRRYEKRWVWVVLPLAPTPGIESKAPEPPPGAPVQWEALFTGMVMSADQIDWRAQLAVFPVAVFTGVIPDRGRNAGALLPLFSVPSEQGIGSLGQSAQEWVRFLSRSGQRIWQLLPLNPISEASGWSPYAASSAFAGEPLYIDMALLVADGLLCGNDSKNTAWSQSTKVSYKEIWEWKAALLWQAWKTFLLDDFLILKRDFACFLKEQVFWLEDYALFVVLKQKYKDAPWYEWPEPLRDRHRPALDAIKEEDREAIDYEQWLQFLFFRQWRQLKHVAVQYGVALMGDLPFYMNHDSVDTWVHRRCFMVDAGGHKQAQAGVPPDYFSETGQLWGMPTYNWDALRKEGYSWWLQRLAANIAMYDLVRLDHFRAFYDYWELPGNAVTAVDGQWRAGPRDHLFALLQQAFPTMPFVAEDLGDLHQEVFDFKDHYQLPGMRVLQFGFSGDDSTLRDLPHNFDRQSVVYTGTHDNDTTLGWYRQLDADAKAALSAYSGFDITENNVAEAMCRMAYASVARILILPLQDILGLDSDSRINVPATTDGNWNWRLKQLPDETIARHLREWVRRYNR